MHIHSVLNFVLQSTSGTYDLLLIRSITFLQNVDVHCWIIELIEQCFRSTCSFFVTISSLLLVTRTGFGSNRVFEWISAETYVFMISSSSSIWISSTCQIFNSITGWKFSEQRLLSIKSSMLFDAIHIRSEEIAFDEHTFYQIRS